MPTQGPERARAAGRSRAPLAEPFRDDPRGGAEVVVVKMSLRC
jgi:hypothetical protein